MLQIFFSTQEYTNAGKVPTLPMNGFSELYGQLAEKQTFLIVANKKRAY